MSRYRDDESYAYLTWEGRVAHPDRLGAGQVLRADPAATARRRDALKAYMDEHVLGAEGFCCASYAAFRGSVHKDDRFFEGQLSHVGRHYDLDLDGRPLRVVVVGQENGAPNKGIDPSYISMDERYRQIPRPHRPRASTPRGWGT